MLEEKVEEAFLADINIRFMITFEDPFWIGIYECEQGAEYSVAKV